MISSKTAIVWFRQDLRLEDNTALIHAVDQGYDVLPLYVLDDENAGAWKRGAEADEILPALVQEVGAAAVFWNRCYEPWRITRDTHIKEILRDLDVEVKTFKDALLWEPWDIKKGDGTPYKVFTPFYRRGCLEHSEPAEARPAPVSISYADFADRGTLDTLGFLPEVAWYQSFEPVWEPSESGARAQLQTFLDGGLKGYKEDRNRPDRENISRLSPYLAHGNISPRVVWHEARARGAAERLEVDTDHFCSELGWREFSYSLLYYNPDMPREPLQKKFAAFPWADNPEHLERWKKGQTGIPIVDAGMRQLWQTGWMHNRVRMIVASVLIKNMLTHWHHGEDWFWDCLVDADLANNAASWQWVAGSGADAAPYFRIFNAITQGEKFDPNGDYIRAFVPELRDVNGKYIHKPWETGGHDYVAPIVDLKKTREVALEAFKALS